MENNRRALLVLTVLLLLAGLWLLEQDRAPAPPADAPRAPGPAEGYLFCAWNVENLYDDQDDEKYHDEDEDWFASHPELVQEKVRLLADALLRQNDGRGPDILALEEVESRRAADLLREALNDRLPTELRYDGVVFRENKTGRRFAPAVITRLTVRDDLTRTFGIRRILEAHLEAEGAPLTILASHWTSRLRGDTEGKREAYADTLYARVNQLTQGDPAADILLSGDFNDEPKDPSLTDHLHATADAELVGHEAAGQRVGHLFDLTGRLDPTTDGTYLHNGRWEILDHIVAAPGLLDPRGWSVRPETLRTENGPERRFGRDRRPWRFGGPKTKGPRGPSDHFALTVRLRVGP